MTPLDLETLLAKHCPDSQITVTLNGNSANITVIGDIFISLNKVKRQQLVYKAIQPLIADGRLHAVIINTHTLEESSKNG